MRKHHLRRPHGSSAPIIDSTEYPSRWSQYVGQEPAVKMLQVAAESARIRKEPMDHILIAHPTPGIGKTALAVLVAKTLRRPCRVVSGAVTTGKARMILSQMQDRDVLLYDEAHRVAEGRASNAEWLLHFLQDGVIMGPHGPEPQPRVTLIAATTHPQKIPEAILTRFTLVPMQDYNTDEAARIARTVMAPQYLQGLPRLTRADAIMIAQAAGNNPRSIKKLLKSLRDMTLTKALQVENGRYDIKGMLDWLGITEDGLDLSAQRYLEALAVDFEGKAGAKALEDRLRQVGGLADTERLLMDRGLVAPTRTGRELTQAGLARYNELAG